ncbi:hypothetical protein GGR54DRAFT_505783 [Hypoxylon sp. NC1633]|nr:hypothetical protein GGR54DRAFT_505783 [Hypoxylon sp. NC1633]
MNWTEGNLSRHSRGRQRNELLTRQKQHFAKVRSNLHTGSTKQSPVSISFLGTQHLRTSGRRHDSAGNSYEPPSTPLLAEARKRRQDSRSGLDSQSSLREKRRRLLENTDWVGLDLQQPIDITFPGPLQASSGSGWAKGQRPRVRAVPKRLGPADATRSEAKQVRNPPTRVQIGSQEIRPSASTSSQPAIRRYSLAPQPLASSSQTRSTPISSPEPSHARHLYVAPEGSQSSNIPKGSQYEIAGERGDRDVHFKIPIKPPAPETPSFVVYSSSIIHEPIPRRANDSMILQLSPSESANWGSMEVEIERPASPVPPTQYVDQEIWKNWVVSPSDNLPMSDSNHPQITIPSVSSSVTTLPSHLKRKLPSYDFSSDSGMILNHQLSESSTNNLEETEDIDTRNHRSPEQKLGHDQNQIERKDDNHAWMKFALDDHSDEIEARAFTEAAHQAAVELHPSETSTSGLDVIETVATRGTDPLLTDEKEQDQDIAPGFSSDSHMAAHSTLASEPTSSNVATTGSTSLAELESKFRFTQPRTFVGKLAGSTAATHGSSVLSAPKKRGRGRPKKRVVDGRTNIRGLPDFDGDPIEEFGEDE